MANQDWFSGWRGGVGLGQEPQGQGKGNVSQTEMKYQPKRLLPAPGEAARQAEPGWVTLGQGKGNTRPKVAAERQSRIRAPRSRVMALPRPPSGCPHHHQAPSFVLGIHWGSPQQLTPDLPRDRAWILKGGHAGVKRGQPQAPPAPEEVVGSPGGPEGAQQLGRGGVELGKSTETLFPQDHRLHPKACVPRTRARPGPEEVPLSERGF